MFMTDAKEYEQFKALRQTLPRQMAKARAVAEKAAFDDLRKNEQQRYMKVALEAVQATEVS